MKKYLLLYAAATTALLLYGLSRYRSEVHRLKQNQLTLAAEAQHLRDGHDEACATVQVLRLRCAEFEQLRAEDARRIRQMGIRLRRLEAAARHVAATRLDTAAPLRDTVVIRLRDTVTVRDTLRLFRWRDEWVTVEGRIAHDTVHCRIESTDTLRQIVHRIPRRFLFIRWGTKALRQEIRSTNPHTRIVASEYVRIER